MSATTTTLRIVSQNVFGVPLVGRSRVSTTRATVAAAADADVVCLQESFDDFLDTAVARGLDFRVATRTDSWTAGLALWLDRRRRRLRTRWGATRSFVFQDADVRTSDWLARKGALAARVAVTAATTETATDDAFFWIVTTHLQSTGDLPLDECDAELRSVWRAQCRALRDFVVHELGEREEAFVDPRCIGILVVGDMNADPRTSRCAHEAVESLWAPFGFEVVGDFSSGSHFEHDDARLESRLGTLDWGLFWAAPRTVVWAASTRPRAVLRFLRAYLQTRTSGSAASDHAGLVLEFDLDLDDDDDRRRP